MISMIPFLGNAFPFTIGNHTDINLPYLEIFAHDIEFEGGFDNFFKRRAYSHCFIGRKVLKIFLPRKGTLPYYAAICRISRLKA